MNIFKTLATKVATNAPKAATAIVTAVRAKSPVIFAGTAIVGAGVIAYTTYKCTPKYKQAVKEAEDNIKSESANSKEPVKVEKKEKAKIFVKTMWPMMVAIIVTVTSIIASHKISAKRIATLSAAYSIATQKATEAAEKKAEEFIKEKLGEDEAKEYADKCEKDHKDTQCAANVAVANALGNNVYDTRSGSSLFIDKLTGTMFRASTGYIQSCLNCINANAPDKLDRLDCFITYNEVLKYIIEDFDEIPIADMVGYSVEELCSYKMLSAKFPKNVEMPNGEMATVMELNIKPVAMPD